MLPNHDDVQGPFFLNSCLAASTTAATRFRSVGGRCLRCRQFRGNSETHWAERNVVEYITQQGALLLPMLIPAGGPSEPHFVTASASFLYLLKFYAPTTATGRERCL